MSDASCAFLLTEDDPPSKREILRCALHLFVRDGLCETSIRDIAQASGYTNPALYKFFESKDALALHLFERCYLRLVSAIHASQQWQDFASNLDALVDTYARLADESLESALFVNDTFRVFWPKLSRAARQRSLLGEIRALVDRGIAEGALPRVMDSDLAVAAILGTMAQVARMAYFRELAAPISDRAAGLRLLFRRALLADRA